MKVKLVAITKPLVGDGNMTASDFITFAARVSNPSNQMSLLTAPKLLAYCIKHGHWSIFEQASMTVEIVTSRAISAQIIRHRSFCFQEFSQRYAASDAVEPIELRTQDTKNRQGSGDSYDQQWAKDAVSDSVDLALQTYRNLLQNGVSRETARMVLPLCTQTTLYMTGNIRSWIHYFEQRCAKGTQKEHRDIALAIRDEIFAKHFEVIHQAIQQKEEGK
jgi:thymidylate synthase (FAD)